MKRIHYRPTVPLLILTVLLCISPLAAQEGDWKSLKHQEKREAIDAKADESLEALFDKSAKAKELFESSYGWAAFDSLKLAIGISGGGGKGVAVAKEGDERVYMEMGTAGVGFSLGGQRYQVVFLFQDSKTFRHFVDSGWQADASASAVAGTDGANAQTGFVNGLAIYPMTQEGLMLAADIAGTKYWKDGKLNN